MEWGLVQADLPNGAYQQTKYVYGVTTAGGNGVNSNDILAAVQHPDKTTGNPSSTEQDSYKVNTLGQVISATDRNGNVHAYTYDVLGRMTADAVTTLGTGVDGSVRRIEVTYDTQENPYLLTSYDAATAGNVVNQVQRAFNGLGQLTTEYQSHSGVVNTGTTPKVQYAYTEMAGGVNNSRLTSMTYPNGRVLNYNYSTGLNDSISRLSSLSDTSATLESYDYLGLSTVVRRVHPQPGVDLTYIKQSGESNGDAGDQYTGLDRFGRVDDQRWLKTSTGVATDRFQYSYDHDSNRLTRTNAVNTSFNESYSYDTLNQLTSFTRGSHSQSWNLDALGNFFSVTTDGVQQNRTFNAQDQIATLNGSAVITYDANGNTTADGLGRTFIYDAWNRLVQVKTGSTVQSTYQYDALGRRIVENIASTAKDLYYSAAWQVLEERVSGAVKTQYVWSPVYVDALVERDRDPNNSGTLSERLYVQQDANWNVIALLDTSGNVVERYAYDPYGNVTILNASWGTLSASAYAWMYLFQGGRFDDASQLYGFRNRDLSPALGRWMQNDPKGFGAGDTNLYRDVGDNPTGAVDPVGLDSSLYDSFWSSLSPTRGDTSTGPGFASNGILSIPNTGTYKGPDAVDALNRQMDARAPMMNQGKTPPPMTPGMAEVYCTEGRNFYAQAVEAGYLIKEIAKWELAAIGFVPAGGAAVLVSVVSTAISLSEGDWQGAAWSALGTVGRLNACDKGRIASGLIRGANIVHTSKSIYDAYESFSENSYVSGGLSALNAVSGVLALLGACFAAGTPLLTPDGEKSIEEFKPGDLVLARPEFEPEGAFEAKVVQDVFVTEAPVINLHVCGQVIRTTGEHPFWVQGRGWVAAKDLHDGDLLSGHNGQWMPIECVTDRGEVTTVYNLRVADYHTYFVGSKDWRFSIWAHNQCTGVHWTTKQGEAGIDASRIIRATKDLVRFERALSLSELKKILKGGGPRTGAAGNAAAIIVDLEGLVLRIIGGGGVAYRLPAGFDLSARGLLWWWNSGSTGEIKQIVDFIRQGGRMY